MPPPPHLLILLQIMRHSSNHDSHAQSRVTSYITNHSWVACMPRSAWWKNTDKSRTRAWNCKQKHYICCISFPGSSSYEGCIAHRKVFCVFTLIHNNDPYMLLSGIWPRLYPRPKNPSIHNDMHFHYDVYFKLKYFYDGRNWNVNLVSLFIEFRDGSHFRWLTASDTF